MSAEYVYKLQFITTMRFGFIFVAPVTEPMDDVLTTVIAETSGCGDITVTSLSQQGQNTIRKVVNKSTF